MSIRNYMKTRRAIREARRMRVAKRSERLGEEVPEKEINVETVKPKPIKKKAIPKPKIQKEKEKTMEITLNKANKLRNELEKMSIPNNYTVFLRTDMFREEITDIFLVFKTELLSSFQRNNDILKHLYALRNLINGANHKNGVSLIINQIACYQLMIKAIENRIQQIRYNARYKTLADFEADIAYRQSIEKAKPGEGSMPSKESVTLLDKEDLANLEIELAKKKKELTGLEESRNALNFETRIKLPEGLSSFLKEVNLL